MYPEFTDMIQKYYLFFVTETKLDSTDIISIDGYTFKSKPRKQKLIRKSGGLSVIVKSNLDKYIEIINTESDYILWA